MYGKACRDCYEAAQRRECRDAYDRDGSVMTKRLLQKERCRVRLRINYEGKPRES
jgi:hypothetical protein